MKTKRVGWLLIFLSYVGVVLAQNLDDQERRWAISGSWGGNWPIVTKNTLSGKAVSAGHIHTLMLEYYIPYTRFSLKELIYIFFLVLLSPWNIISGWALPER